MNIGRSACYLSELVDGEGLARRSVKRPQIGHAVIGRPTERMRGIRRSLRIASDLSLPCLGADEDGLGCRSGDSMR